tara:strand:+ start:12599 stop:13738 length:1140 start_codon:yes stop_codon:yes gene_type:complete
MMSTKIYLDYNATAPLHPDAWTVMNPLLCAPNAAYNASAVHGFGREGRRIVEQARTQISQLVGAERNQIIFNSGATEGNNTVLRHFADRFPDDIILVSAIEHPSILELQNVLPNIRIIPVDNQGLIDISALEILLKEHSVSLVSCMIANNESGVIQDVSEISKIAHQNNALFHCDATQAVGRIPVNMQASGIDFLTLSSHKIGGPQGVGALALGLCGQTPTLLHGGGQEKSARAGTENVAGVAGFGAAAQAALHNLDHYQNLLALRDEFEREIKEISPEVIIHSKDVTRLPNTSFFSLPDTDSQTLLMALDLEGVAVSNGSACSSGTVKASTVLRAMGLDEKTASSALRISMGWATKENDINAMLDAWQKIYARIKEKR